MKNLKIVQLGNLMDTNGSDVSEGIVVSTYTNIGGGEMSVLAVAGGLCSAMEMDNGCYYSTHMLPVEYSRCWIGSYGVTSTPEILDIIKSLKYIKTGIKSRSDLSSAMLEGLAA